MALRYSSRKARASGIKFVCKDGRKEVGRTYLYVLRNDLHREPFGFIEDVFVDESRRGQGIMSKLHEMAVAEARRQGCYKIVLSSRSERTDVHDMYRHLGYEARGVAFRLDLGGEKK